MPPPSPLHRQPLDPIGMCCGTPGARGSILNRDPGASEEPPHPVGLGKLFPERGDLLTKQCEVGCSNDFSRLRCGIPVDEKARKACGDVTENCKTIEREQKAK